MIQPLAYGIAFLLVLLGALERWCKNEYLARKITHCCSGIVLLLVPAPFSVLSTLLILGFSCFMVVYSLKPGSKEAVVAPTSSSCQTKVSNFLRKRIDWGIVFFAIAVNCAAFLNISYRWLLPLFVADPAAALVGRYLSSSPNQRSLPTGFQQKTCTGTLAFFVTAAVSIYLAWTPPELKGTSESCVAAAVAAAISAAVELCSGSCDNFAIAISGFLFSYYFPQILRLHILLRVAFASVGVALGLNSLSSTCTTL